MARSSTWRSRWACSVTAAALLAPAPPSIAAPPTERSVGSTPSEVATPDPVSTEIAENQFSLPSLPPITVTPLPRPDPPPTPEEIEQLASVSAIEEIHALLGAKKERWVTRDPETPSMCADPQICRRVKILAGVAGGLSAATTVAGVVLATRPDQPIEGDPSRLRSTRVIGLTAIAAGVAAAITTTIMAATAIRGRRGSADPLRLDNPARTGKTTKAYIEANRLHF